MRNQLVSNPNHQNKKEKHIEQISIVHTSFHLTRIVFRLLNHKTFLLEKITRNFHIDQLTGFIQLDNYCE